MKEKYPLLSEAEIKQIVDPVWEKHSKDEANDKTLRQLIKDAKSAINSGLDLESFVQDQIAKKETGEQDADVREIASEAYRAAEQQIEADKEILAEEKIIEIKQNDYN